MKKALLIFVIISLIASMAMSTSLWSTSKDKKFKSLFAMKVANQVGDTLNVMVYDNTTASFSYSNPDYKGGLLSVLVGLLKSVTNFDLSKFIPINSSPNINTTKRTAKNQSQFVTQIAAVITKIEPNGNFYIKGSKEVKVGQSMKQVQIEGIVNPNDISQDNTIDSSKIADLKIWYDGSLIFQQGVNQNRWINWIFNSLSSVLF